VARSCLVVSKESVPLRVAVVVEHQRAEFGYNMISTLFVLGSYPYWAKINIGISVYKRVSENVAGATCKKDPIR
jgi:hypothetical protein